MRRAILLAAPLALAGCADAAPALPQWRVVIATDAPVPQFGDRLLIEVLDDAGAACTACRRQIPAPDADAWPVSFGVAPPERGGVRVRVRLYRTAVTGYDGSPGSDRILDSLVRLPPLDGVTPVAVRLDMRCFGLTSDPVTDSTCDPETGSLGPTLAPGALKDETSLPKPGSWAPAQKVDCAGPAEAGMVCIPGGAFLMGAPQYLPVAELDPVPEQLVQVSPFYLDADEMTVAAYRPLAATAGEPVPKGTGPSQYCTYSAAAAADTMPVNCVSLAQARAACKALGKRLPTEAEWEWAAGNLGLESKYPWITGPPCANAVVGYGFSGDGTTSTQCLPANADPGPRPVRSAADTTLLGVHDLGGNLAEWIEDELSPYADTTCWGPQATLRVNPLCKSGGSPVLRGGSWVAQAVFAGVALRNANQNTKASQSIGFRCAK